MKSKNKIYKFSAADVVLYIKDHVNMADDVVSIIKKNTKSLDQKTINKLSIVNDVVKHIGNLITYAQENIVLEDNVFENTKSNITKVTTIIDMIITGIISKIVKFSLLSFVTLPAIILCKIQIFHLFT